MKLIALRPGAVGLAPPGNVLCDRTVTLAFDAVPEGGAPERLRRRALCVNISKKPLEEKNG